MSGKTDLSDLLRGLRPDLLEVEVGFASLMPDDLLLDALKPIGSFREAEGTTVIAPIAQLTAAGLAHSGPWAQITLTIHSSLDAVGMIAAVAVALAREGIGTNPVAGYFHDHLFVPWQRRHDAMAALTRLSADQGTEHVLGPSATGLTVRRATLGDVDALEPLFDAYRGFYEQPSDLALARAFLSERLSAHDSIIFIGQHNGKAVGFTQLYPSFSSTRAQRIYILNDLFVAPEARRSGLAGMLLASAACFARSQGALRLTLSTARTNAPSQALYEDAGWLGDDEFKSYNLVL